MKSYFPDVNVWVALAYRGHQHHAVAASWFERLKSEAVCFCRLTHLGFLRSLTHAAVMRYEVKTQLEAWKAYDLLASDSRVAFYLEPDLDAVESELRALTTTTRFAPRQWPDAYLATFAKVAGFTLVTLDGALSKLAGEDVLLLK